MHSTKGTVVGNTAIHSASQHSDKGQPPGELERVLAARGDPWAVLNLDPQHTWEQVKAAGGLHANPPQEGLASTQAETFARLVRRAYRNALSKIHPDRLVHPGATSSSSAISGHDVSDGVRNLISEACSLVSDSREKLLAGGVAMLSTKICPPGTSASMPKRKRERDDEDAAPVQQPKYNPKLVVPLFQPARVRPMSDVEALERRKSEANAQKRKSDALSKVEERRKKELQGRTLPGAGN
jgi:hypothetical protein